MGGRVIPIGSMYGIFTYIYHKFMINVGNYKSHGSYGIKQPLFAVLQIWPCSLKTLKGSLSGLREDDWRMGFTLPLPWGGVYFIL